MQLWDPNAVLTHHAAAWLTFWPTVRLPRVHMATRHRWRQNDLVNAGWRVLRFTARMVEETPHLVLATIREALAA